MLLVKLLVVCLVAAVAASLLSAYSSHPATTCTTIYFLNSIVIDVDSSYSGVLYLETPLNFSALGLNQTSRAVVSRAVSYRGRGEYAIEVAPGSPLYAYIVFEVRTCSPGFDSSLTLIREALLDPVSVLQKFRDVAYSAGDMPVEYLGKSPEVVRDRVRREFEDWLRSFNWYQLLENASRYPLLVSVYAAKFVYASGYVQYEASLLPRTLEEVVEERKGDCDDMSRLLVALLWSYGIPAVIVHGFTSIPDFSMRSTLGTLEYIFERGGPHAFVLAYVPSYGWLSLDFLAGSLLTRPVVIWGTTKNIEVSRRDVEEVVELHRAIVGKQFMTVILPDDFRLYDRVSLELLINSSLGLSTLASLTPMSTPIERTTSIQPTTDTTTKKDWEVATTITPVLATIAVGVAIAVIAVITLRATSSRRGLPHVTT